MHGHSVVQCRNDNGEEHKRRIQRTDEAYGPQAKSRDVAFRSVRKPSAVMCAEGQVQGGLVHGLGFAFMEELTSENGKILNDSFTDYKMLTSMDAPKIGIIFVESNDPNGPYGAKALGEPPLVAAAPTIANAIYNAIGVRIKETPITPEKILKALKNKA